MRKGDAKAPSQRQLKVGEELRHALAWMLERGEVHDPGLDGVTLTVTEVTISPDLKNATAYVVPLGGAADVDGIVATLNHAAPFLRRRIGQAVKLRHVPGLEFAYDRGFDAAGRIETLLHEPRVARDLALHGDDGEDGDAGGDPGDGA